MVWLALGSTAALLSALLLFLLRSSRRRSIGASLVASQRGSGPDTSPANDDRLVFGPSSRLSLSRRSHLRLLILGATGLSLLPGCGGDGRPSDSLLDRWARLGRIWRDLSTYLRGVHGGAQELAGLKKRMEAVLDALPAWAELQAVFETRYEHVARILSGLPCYAPLPPGCYPNPQFRVEDRVEHLEKLVAEGRLSERAAVRAAGALAIPAEYLVQEGEIKKRPYEEWYPALDELDERYCDGTLEAGPAAELAGKRLVELTVDKLGWLAGRPSPDEGVSEPPIAADVAEEEAEP